MIRVLHVVGNMDFGGVETLLMNLYRFIDRDAVQFDFLCHNNREGKYDEEIRGLGGHIHRVPGIRASSLAAYRHALYDTFAGTQFEIVHSHLNAINGIVLAQAKRAGVAHRISHSHSHNAQYSISQTILRAYSGALISSSATRGFACSQEAARFLHRGALLRSTKILNNAIDVSRFSFDAQTRDRLRRELGLASSFVVGHVGRFERQKNHTFLIDTFAAFAARDENAHLLLVGTGSLTSEVQRRVEALGLEGRVRFLGPRSDVRDLMCAMDAFVFPSLFEGLGIVAIEAQAVGLPVIAADTLPRETDVTDRIEFLQLAKPSDWVAALERHRSRSSHLDRSGYPETVAQAGFDVRQVAVELQHFYESLVSPHPRVTER